MGNTAILQGVCKMEAGLDQCKEPNDEKLLQVVYQWMESCLFNDKVALLCPSLSRRTESIKEDRM